MIYKKNIFDIGAFNGLDGLIMALKNPKQWCMLLKRS